MVLLLCRICNGEYAKGGIAMHLKGAHKLVFRDYIRKFIDKFPGDFPFWRINGYGKLVRIGDQEKKRKQGYAVKESIECRICHQQIGMKGMPIHTRMHDVIYEQYVRKYFDLYPNDFPNWTRCVICNIITKQKISCSRICDREYRKTLVGEKSPRYGIPTTKKAKEKISKKAKERLSNPENHWASGKTVSLKTRVMISKKQKLNAKKDDYINPMKGKTHTPEAIKKIFEHRKMNKLEKLVATILDKNSIKYYFQYFINKDGICKSYDFKIKNKLILIEVDGDYWHGGPGHKYEQFYDVKSVQRNDELKDDLAQQNGFKILRFWESDIKDNSDIVMERLNEII